VQKIGMVKELHGGHLVLDVLRAVLPCRDKSAAFHSALGFKTDMHLLGFRIRTETIADPDPDFYLNADPDPGSQTNADPNLNPDLGQTLPSQKVGF
jgi:hypothetical protein